ncbi:MAG: PKD domain-containing protein [Rhodothermales bacterium]|nr:PKD domain-containing protein [Rhodothermales bacterium]
MERVLGLVALLCLATGVTGTVQAQTHFTGCVSSTGENATVLVNDTIGPSIDGVALASGDEIAVFTTEGLCVGVEVWTGINIALTVWGDNSLTTEKDGLSASEQMNFVVWDASSQTEFGNSYGSVDVAYSSVSPYNGTGLYDSDAIYQLTLLAASTPRHPVAAASATPTSGSTPLLVTFDASASSDEDGSIISYAWDFGDGGSGSGVGTTNTFMSAGTYPVVLTVTDDDAYSSTDTVTIVVSPAPTNVPPTASFSLTPDSGQAPLTVTVDASGSSDSDGSIVSYTWTFGDGSSATGVSASHEYSQAGTFSVVLTVTDDDGATASETRTVSVLEPNNQPPAAAFSASTSTGVIPLLVTFDASSSTDPDGSIATYTWNFGDGSAATGVSTSKTYTVAGSYIVTLTVTDDDGASSLTQQTILASAGTSNLPPVAAFTLTPSVGTAPVTVATDGSASTDSDGTISSYAWDYGDGATGTGVTDSHTYSTSGTYTVTLTVSDNNGATGSSSQTVTVSSPPTAGPLVMHLTFDESSGQNATDVSTNGNDGTLQGGAEFATAGILSGAVLLNGGDAYVDVADNAVLNQQIVSKRTISIWFRADDVSVSSRKQVIWEEGGQQKGLSIYLFNGSLYVGGWNKSTSESGWDGTFLSTSAVQSNTWNHVALVLNGGPTVSPGALLGYLNGASIGNGTASQVWSHNDDIGIGRVDGDTWFHDATNKSGQTHGFSGYIDDVRVYNQVLTQPEINDLANGGGASQNLPPNAVIDVDQQSGPAPLQVNFSATRSSDNDGSIQSYSWTLGNGEFGTGPTVAASYTTAGTYSVTLTVIDNDGATSSANATITVEQTVGNAPPRAEIVETLGRRNSMSISLNGESSSDPDGSIVHYDWDFGDGATSTGPSATHEYSSPGSFQVILTVTDDVGLQGSSTFWVSVYDLLPEGTGSSLVGAGQGQDPGFASYDGETLTLRSSAAVPSASSDVFRFVHETVSGDATITVRIEEISSGQSSARIGVMLRSQLTPAATMAHLTIDGTGQAHLESRPVAGAPATFSSAGSFGIPGWIRISRQGNTFRTFASVDGAVWTPTGQVEIGMPETVFMGVTASSQSGSSFDASLDNVAFESTDEALPAGYLLSEAYPNPFNPASQITLVVDQAQEISVSVYSVTGVLVQQLFIGEVAANQLYEYRFAATDGLASGTYFLRVYGESFAATRAVVLLK